jgi:hypothetical protein
MVALLSILLPAAPAAAQSAEDSSPIDVRLRAGLSAGGGLMVITGPATAFAPSFNLAGRLGVQIGSVFSLYYQPMATFVIPTDGSGFAIADYNAFLADVTLGDHVGLGFGPSGDVISVTGNNVSVTRALFGLHSRIAYHIGRDGQPGPRRQGLSIGLDVHPTFGPGGTLVTTQLGIGYEWY